MSDEYPWRNKEKLIEGYWRDEKTPTELSNEWGCSVTTIVKWMNKHGVRNRQSIVFPWNDEDTLRELYWEKGFSLRAIADRLETTLDKVNYWFKKHEIETRKAYDQQKHASYKLDKDGYAIWKVYHNGTRKRLPVHRLLAVAEYGFDAVVDKDCHHISNIPWDNRPSNIRPIDPSEHRRIHGLARADEQRKLMMDLRSKGEI